MDQRGTKGVPATKDLAQYFDKIIDSKLRPPLNQMKKNHRNFRAFYHMGNNPIEFFETKDCFLSFFLKFL